MRAPATGIWTAPDGRTEQDDVVMVEVVTERFDRHWWRTYTAKLAERFGQDAIHVRASRSSWWTRRPPMDDGTRWLQAGGDIYKLSKILGHSSVAVTEQHYAHLLKEDLVAELRDWRLGHPEAIVCV